jgi:hypothetical protein
MSSKKERPGLYANYRTTIYRVHFWGRSMFTTYSHAELWPGTPTGGQSARSWIFVEQEAIWPWFYIQVARDDGSELSCTMLMIATVPHFEQLLNQRSKRLWLENVQLVTPGYMNGKGEWAMGRLLELYVAVDNRSGEPGHVFQTASGQNYTTHPSDQKWLQRSFTIFSAAEHLGRPRDAKSET